MVEAIRKKVPVIYEFLDARFVKPSHYPRVKNKKLKPALLQSRVKQDIDAANPNKFMPLKYAAEPMEIWSKHSAIKNYFFGHDSDKGGSEIIMKFFDIPYLHTYSREGVDFIYVLYEAAELDAKVCDHESINMLINQHWRQNKLRFHLY